MKNARRSNVGKWWLSNRPLQDKIAIWERVVQGEPDTRIVNWLQEHAMELDRGTVGLIRRELEELRIPDELVPSLPEMVKAFRERLLHEQRIQRNEESAPQQPQSPLTLTVVSPKVSKHGQWSSTWRVSIDPKVEIIASQYVRVTGLVLVMKGKQIEESRPYHAAPRELLGSDTWHPSFDMPGWVRPGTYMVCVGARRVEEFSQMFSPSGYEREVEIVKSNEFEVRIPVWPTPRMEAKEEARQRANREAHTLDIGIP